MKSFLILTLIICTGVASAQSKATKKALVTGFERKLDVTYKTVGDREMKLDIYYPDTKFDAPYPTVVYTHGGGWAAGSRFGASKGSFSKLFKRLTADGFCIVSIDYRLYSKTNSVRIRDCVTDSKDAVRFLVKNHDDLKIDPERLFSFGDSAGGHLAQMLLLSPSDSFAGDELLSGVSHKMVAGVSWYGPVDFQDQSLFNHDDRENFKDRFCGRILHVAENELSENEKMKCYQEVSPVTYLSKDSRPLLMIQGDKDTTIPVKHAHHIEKLAKKTAAPVEILIVKNSGHNWRKVDQDISPTRDEIIDRTARFFGKQLELLK